MTPLSVIVSPFKFAMSNAREQAVVAVGAAEEPMEGGDRCSQNLGFIAVKLAPPHHRDGAWQYMAGLAMRIRLISTEIRPRNINPFCGWGFLVAAKDCAHFWREIGKPADFRARWLVKLLWALASS